MVKFFKSNLIYKIKLWCNLKFMKNIKNKFLFNAIFILVIFILAIIVWYSPVLFKGYSTYSLNINVLLARNIHLIDLHSAENNLNVILSTDLIQDNGVVSIRGNKLTPLLYSKVFDIFGLFETNNLIFLSIFIYALTLIIFTVLILYLFDFKIALIFSLIYIFLPFNWHLPYGIGAYEFALLFLSLFFFLFFYGIKNKYHYIYLPISGIFLALACLSREVFLLIAPFLLLFLWFKKQKINIIFLFIPFIIVLAIFWLPNISNNDYIKLFTSDLSNEAKSSDVDLYPDPYTYHFEQEIFLFDLQNKIDNNEIVLMKELDRIKELKNAGVGEISLFDRARIGLVISLRHIFRFVSLEDIGGPFIFFLIILGLYSLKQKNRYLYQFFVYWVFSAVFLMSFVVLAVRNHLMDFNWVIALLISLGIIFLVKLINNYLNFKKKKQVFLYIVFLSIIIYHFILVDHIVWSRAYNNNSSLMVQAYSQEIKKLNIIDNNVIVVNLTVSDMYNLNYLTNKSVVIFKPETIKNLLKENKLDYAFEQFNVKYILGYSDELSERIVEQTNIINISSNSLKPISLEISRNKGWLMNLIK